MMIKHSRQRGEQILLAHAGRHLQQHRLIEALDPPATLQQPAHDRGERQWPSSNIGQRRQLLADKHRRRGKRLNRLMLEHHTRRDPKPRLARPAHQLDRHDAVAAQRKEIVRNPYRPNAEHLRKKSAQDLLLRRARSLPHPFPPSHYRRRQGQTVELAVRRERKLLQLHKRRRHHVLRQMPPHMRAQLAPTRSRSPATHHKTDQPLAPARIRTQHNRSLRNPSMPQKNSLDLPRLNAKTTQLDLPIRTAKEIQNPLRTPARYIPAAVHPAPRTPIRVGNKPLRSQPRTPQIAARYACPRYVKLPRYPSRYRLQIIVQNINPRVPDRTANGHYLRPVEMAAPTRDIDSGFRGAIQVLELHAGQQPRYLKLKLRSECLAAAYEVSDACFLLYILLQKERLQHGRNKMQEGHTVPLNYLEQPL